MSSPTPLLEWIDAYESLRQRLLEESPALSRPIQERLAADWRTAAGRDRATLALVCALDLPELTPAVRRHARVLLQRFEEEGYLDDLGASFVSEDRLPQFAELPAEERGRLARDVNWIATDEFTAELATAKGPGPALAMLERRAKILRGNRGARFLVMLGYPMVIPDRARRRWMNRFGLLAALTENRTNRDEALRVLDDFARQTGANLLEADFLLGIFTGAIASEGQAGVYCGNTPRCAECPIRSHCQFGLFLERHGDLVAPPAKPERRNLTDTYLPEERPREKLQAQGPDKLTNAELLAILLRTGSGQDHAVELSNKILRSAGSLERLSKFSVAELTRIPGVGPVKAITIKAALELARRLAEAPNAAEEFVVTRARDVFDRLRGHFLDRQKEQFLCLLLNTKNKVLRQVAISEGTLNQSLVHPREAFQEAIRDGASAVIFVHNHPSGDPSPSRDDRAITARLVQTGDIVGIRVMDHIIIGRQEFFSFADSGELAAVRK